MKELIIVIRGYQKNVAHDPFTLALSGAQGAGVRIAPQFWSCLEFFPAGGPVIWTVLLKVTRE